jgi:hypothetical protein
MHSAIQHMCVDHCGLHSVVLPANSILTQWDR